MQGKSEPRVPFIVIQKEHVGTCTQFKASYCHGQAGIDEGKPLGTGRGETRCERVSEKRANHSSFLFLRIGLWRALPKRTCQQLRRPHLAKSRAPHSTPDVILHYPIKLPPMRVPEHRSRSFVLLMEQVQFLTYLPMIDIVHKLSVKFKGRHGQGALHNAKGPSVPAGPSEKPSSILYRARPPDDPPEKVVVAVAAVTVKRCEFMVLTIKGFAA